MVLVGLRACVAASTAADHDMWLLREGVLSAHATMVPFWVLLVFVLVIAGVLMIPPVNAASNLIAHAGLLAPGAAVLPAEARTWSPEATKRALAALALENRDLKLLYRGRAAAPAEQAADGGPSRRRRLFGLRRTVGVA